ncbi:TetR/AcrR family transcriptional regulator [Gordonia sp. VNQ95]|uniref:TetR/AcrR family transcriptional regulator n=1 Tax=Gordonia sp. VNQ95 TaxID=3156619 RepID=UPI0032B3AEE2
MSVQQPPRRTQIVDAAISILERGGVEALNMRALAAELNMGPMSLYYYVPNKSALLSMVVDETGQRIVWPEYTGSIRDRLVAQVLDIHQRLSEISWMGALLRTSGTNGAPPSVLTESFIASATESGASVTDAYGVWRACWAVVSSELRWSDVDPSAQVATNLASDTTAGAAAAVVTSVPIWAQFGPTFALTTHIAALVDSAFSIRDRERGGAGAADASSAP